MTFEQPPMITYLLASLPIGIALMWLLSFGKDSKTNINKSRWIALLTSTVGLFISLMLLLGLVSAGSSAGFQFVEKHAWIPTLNINYQVGVDGISIFFLPLTSLLFMAIIVASWKRIHLMPKVYYSLLLVLQMATLGIFVATDTILFMLFWELTLIPIYFLIALWGKGPNRRYAATKYILLMMVGGIPLLFGFILLALGSPETGLVFDYVTLLENPLPASQQTLIFFLLFVGFAFKAPLFPFHTWLPVLAMEGPVAIGAIMTGLKLGAYGLIRFTIPLAPEAAINFHWLFAGLGVIGIVYGALMAMQQTNLRSMLAYSSISHIGLVILSLSSFDIQGVEGAVFQLLNFTFISGGLFIIVGFLHARTGTTEIISLGGVATTMPMLATFFFIFGIASIGMPGTSGFPAEFMMLISTLKSHTGAGLAALFGVILGAGYLLTIFRRAFLGPVTSPIVGEAKDLQRRETIVIIALMLLIFVLGIFPSLLLDVMHASVSDWVTRLQPNL